MTDSNLEVVWNGGPLLPSRETRCDDGRLTDGYRLKRGDCLESEMRGRDIRVGVRARKLNPLRYKQKLIVPRVR